MGTVKNITQKTPQEHNNLVRVDIPTLFDPSNSLGGKVHMAFSGAGRNAMKIVDCECEKEMHTLWEAMVRFQEKGNHDNVIKYDSAYYDGLKLILSMKLCDENLEQLVDRVTRGKLPVYKILHQLTKAVAHLHQKKLVHGNLKPPNILVSKYADGTLKTQVADPVFTKEIKDIPEESEGWSSPEYITALRSKPELPYMMTTKSDIFSLGLIFYYILTWGKHPFGNDPLRWAFNIKLYNIEINRRDFSPNQLGYLKLLKKMLAKDPDDRPTAREVLNHFIVWSDKKMRSFIGDVWSAFRSESDAVEAVKQALERRFKTIIGSTTNAGWLKKLCRVVKNYLVRRKKQVDQEWVREYEGNCAVHLYNAVRNLHEHYNDKKFPKIVKKALGKRGLTLKVYWLDKFPQLVRVLWEECNTLVTTYDDYSLNKYYEKKQSV